MRSRRMGRPFGKVSIGTLLFLAVATAGVFTAVKFVPVYLDNMDVGQAMIAVLNDPSNTYDDPTIRMRLRLKLALVGSHQEYDNYGNLHEVQGLQLPDDDIIVDRDDVRNILKVTVRYERPVDLAPLKKVVNVQFIDTKQIAMSH